MIECLKCGISVAISQMKHHLLDVHESPQAKVKNFNE